MTFSKSRIQNVGIDEQAYEPKHTPGKRTQLEEIEKIADEFANLETMIRKMPGRRRRALFGSFLRQRNRNRIESLLKNTAMIALLYTILSKSYELLIDNEQIKEFIRTLFLNNPTAVLSIGAAVLIEIGKIIADSSRTRDEQVRILALKIITQYLIDEKVAN